MAQRAATVLRAAEYLEKISWFPGHMHVATQQLKASLTNIDVFIEVRDARLPYSTFNIEIDDTLKRASKPKIVLFNKYDLCNPQITLKAIKNLREVGVSGFAVSATEKINMSKIIALSRELIPPKHEKTVGSWMMIGGMPNVGKSTIINKLRAQSPTIKGKYATKASKSPAETRGVNGFKVSEKPNSWLVDTPGLMLPSIQAGDLGLKLSLIGCIRDKIVTQPVLVDYLFEVLTKYNVQEWVKHYNLRRVPQSADEVVTQVRERLLHGDDSRTCEYILEDFRAGRLGRVTLDEVELD